MEVKFYLFLLDSFFVWLLFEMFFVEFFYTLFRSSFFLSYFEMLFSFIPETYEFMIEKGLEPLLKMLY